MGRGIESGGRKAPSVQPTRRGSRATAPARRQSTRTGLAEPIIPPSMTVPPSDTARPLGRAIACGDVTGGGINTAGSLQQKIECVAYDLYEQRGRIDGHNWDDWFEAERIVTQREQGSRRTG